MSKAVLTTSRKTHYTYSFAYLNTLIFPWEEAELTSPLVHFAHKDTESQRLREWLKVTHLDLAIHQKDMDHQS